MQPTISQTTTTEKLVAVKFLNALHTLELDKENKSQIENKIRSSLKNSNWKIKSLSLFQLKVNRGLTKDLYIEIDTGKSCIKNQDWINLLGKPYAINLAEPYGFANISTPEAVDRHLNGHVVMLHYRLDVNYNYSLVSDSDSGCFRSIQID